MNPGTASLTLTRWTNTVLIAGFVAFLWLPTLDSLFHFDHTPAINERRQPALFPDHLKPMPAGLKEYLAEVEACFNDHFGCRKQLIRWQIDWKQWFFRGESEAGPSVIIGSDGWLYFAQNQMVEHFRGVRQFTPQNLRDWQALLEHRRDWLAQRGIKYLFVVAPDKHSIYPEYLPVWTAKVRPETKLDQFFAYMRAHSTVAVVDLRPALRDARRIAPTYFKTDTHWNFFGSFTACQAIAQKLPGGRPLPMAAFDLQIATAPGGDLAHFLGLNLAEPNAASLVPKPGLPALDFNTNLVQHPDYVSPCTVTNPQGTGVLLVFCDSFGNAMMPFLGYGFGQTISRRQYELDPEWIEQEKPAVVISEIVEREFNLLDPDYSQAKEALK